MANLGQATFNKHQHQVPTNNRHHMVFEWFFLIHVRCWLTLALHICQTLIIFRNQEEAFTIESPPVGLHVWLVLVHPARCFPCAFWPPWLDKTYQKPQSWLLSSSPPWQCSQKEQTTNSIPKFRPVYGFSLSNPPRLLAFGTTRRPNLDTPHELERSVLCVRSLLLQPRRVPQHFN